MAMKTWGFGRQLRGTCGVRNWRDAETGVKICFLLRILKGNEVEILGAWHQREFSASKGRRQLLHKCWSGLPCERCYGARTHSSQRTR